MQSPAAKGEVTHGALHTLCKLLAAACKRPIAIMPSYRLGPNPRQPHLPPAHRCTKRCWGMKVAPSDLAARDQYRQRIVRSLTACSGFECSVVAPGYLAQWACLQPRPVLAHAAVRYPDPRFGASIEGTWRRNASRLLQSIW